MKIRVPRPTPWFLITVIILALLASSVYIIGSIYLWQINFGVTQSVTPKDTRPDISHCLVPEIDTWDCVRGKQHEG